MPAITISRQYGSGGSEVARLVAEALRWRLVDNAFVDGIATGLNATPAVAKAVDEHVPSLAERIADMFALGGSEVIAASLGAPMPPPEQCVSDVTRQIIDQALALGPAVIVGRGAQSYLAHRDDVVHALCCAPHDVLVRRVMAREQLTRDDADALVRRRNREREQYVRMHFNRAWLAPEHYHLVLNTGWLGIETTATLIVEAARRLIGLPDSAAP